jgi:hypothetical protein
MAVLTGSRLSELPARVIVVSRTPRSTAQVAKVMVYRTGRSHRLVKFTSEGKSPGFAGETVTV